MDSVNWQGLIEGGTNARVKRSGVGVEYVLLALGRGESIERLLEQVPELTREDVLACLAYAADAVSRARFVDSVQRGLTQTAAGLVTEDDAVWEELDRESKD